MKEFLKKNPHYYLLLYIPIYLIWFFVIEKVNVTDYWVSYLPLDDKIPFIPQFVMFYVLWYPFLFAPGVYMLIADAPAFKKNMQFIIAGLSISLFICTVFPNGQDLRPDLAGSSGFFNWLISRIYSADTNTNALPSMHVVGAIASVLGIYHCEKLRKFGVWSIILAVLICASTVFIKQHSILDIITGAALCVPLWYVVYGRSDIKRLKEKKKTDRGKS